MKKNRFITLFIFILIFGIIIVIFSLPSLSPSKAPTNKLTVAASIFPLADISRVIVGDKIEVINLLPPGSSPHTFTITPSDIKKLKQAKIIFIIGDPLDSWTKEITSSLDNITIYPVNQGVQLRTFAEWKKYYQEKTILKENEDNHEQLIDPHYWLSPTNGKIIAQNIYEQIVRLDPQNKSYYNRNLQNFKKQVDQTIITIKSELDDLPQKNMIVFHDSWNYFANEFGLNIVGVFVPAPGKEPSPQYLASLHKLAKKFNIKAVFAEPQLPIETIRPFIADLNLKLYILDPLGGVPPRDSYINMLLYNAKTIKQALGE